MSTDRKPNLIRFLFGESQLDADLTAALEEAGKVERLKVNKAPLASALKSLGISGKVEVDADEECAKLIFTDAAAYHEASRILGSVEAMDEIASKGWVVTDAGDISDTTELPEYVMHFLPVHEIEHSKLNKPLSLKDLTADVEAGADNQVSEADIFATADAMLENDGDRTGSPEDDAEEDSGEEECIACGRWFDPNTGFSATYCCKKCHDHDQSR